MIGRIPLWATLLPLVIGVAVWALVWRGYATEFEAEVAALLPPGSAVSATGFPYRLEVELEPVTVRRSDDALVLGLRAAEVRVNRVPWQRDRQVISLADSVVDAGLRTLAGANIRVAAPEAQASLRMEGANIARLSAVWEGPTMTTGLLPGPIRADRFEAHLRETPSDPASPDSGSPRSPTQAQLVLGGDGVRFGEGDALKLALSAELTAAKAITSLAGWAAGGTVEIESATLADGTGEVARMAATIVPDGAGALRIAGTIDTVCPASVRAAIAGLPPVSEKRVRKAERIAFSGTLPGGVVAAPRDPAKPPAPVRGQEPACPRFR